MANLKHCASSSSPNAGSSGYLHHIKDDIFENVISDDFIDNVGDESTNVTNNEELIYFAHVTNHYLNLVKAYPTFVVSCHAMQYPINAYSGASYHILKEREFFETLHPVKGRVFLGNGKTVLDIQGIVTVKCKIGNDILMIDHVQYIPDLVESIYSLFLHIWSPGHGLTSSFEEGLFIIFPTFRQRQYWVQMTFTWMRFLPIQM